MTAERVSQPEAASRRVLIVDDDRQFCEMLRAWLGTTYQLVFAYDGEAGVRLAKRERPDLILLDVMMPKISGFSLAWVFRNDPFFLGVPVVYCTAHAARWPDAEETLSRADAYLLKPFRLAELSETLERVLAGVPSPEEVLQGPVNLEKTGPCFDTSVPVELRIGEECLPGEFRRMNLWGAIFRSHSPIPDSISGTAVQALFPRHEPLQLGCRFLAGSPPDSPEVPVRFIFETGESDQLYQKLLAELGWSEPPPERV